MKDNIILNVYRGNIVENSHLGHIAVVNMDGKLLYSFGNPDRITHGRSALKPFQVLPLIETGAADRFGFRDADLALCASSHSGEPIHRVRVTSILKSIGLDDRHMQCGVTAPMDKASFEDMIRNHEPITSVCNECSGVHAGMLATAVHMGEDPVHYTEADHAVQKRVKRAVSELTRMPEQEIRLAADGCGIPTYCMPLRHIAWGFARLAVPDKIQSAHREAAGRIVSAYLRHPEMVTGENNYSTRVMRAFGGRILVKEGSQGVFGIADLETGIGVAIKVEDGRKTELPPVLNELLCQLKIGVNGILDQLRGDSDPPLENTLKHRVGQFKAEFKLVKHQ